MFKAPEKQLKPAQFVGMLAMLSAIVAFSIDAMLPAIPAIATQMTPDDPNFAQLVITSFISGLGLGTFISGPISDRYGRKSVAIFGLAIYIISALYASITHDIGHLLACRFLMGIGASGPRVVSLAMVRDLYEGREMARIVSFVMTVFILVPAVAPAIGTVIIAFSSWRGIFIAFVLFALFSGSLLTLRQPETLAHEKRRPLLLKNLQSALGEVLATPVVLLYIVVMSLASAELFAFLSSVPQIFKLYGRSSSFPLWFALAASFAAISSFLNARLVMTVGMRKLVSRALLFQFTASLTALTILSLGLVSEVNSFYIFLGHMVATFSMIGLLFGNLNGLAMEPMGHMAGFAAAIIGSSSMIFAVFFAVPVGYAFNGTPFPLIGGVALFSGLGFLLMHLSRRYKKD
ncbi:MAG: multidrug effflux MFS transporter, partial [Desulfobulbaceae bacterium]|nr:multidrug effflux MFS transporter [Desulfobulbaceae bacterium]